MPGNSVCIAERLRVLPNSDIRAEHAHSHTLVGVILD